MTLEQEMWDFLHRHIQSIFSQDVATYKATTAEDLSLYEWFVTPHRQDGLEFHLFATFHIDKNIGAVFELKIQFLAFIGHVKQDYLVLGIAQVLERSKQIFCLARLLHHVGENDHERTAMYAFRNLVQAGREVGRFVQLLLLYEFR